MMLFTAADVSLGRFLERTPALSDIAERIVPPYLTGIRYSIPHPLLWGTEKGLVYRQQNR